MIDGIYRTDAEWFRKAIEDVFGDGGQSSLARFLILCGDKRELGTIRRSISNYASGRSPLLPEMRALLRVLRDRGEPVEALLHKAMHGK